MTVYVVMDYDMILYAGVNPLSARAALTGMIRAEVWIDGEYYGVANYDDLTAFEHVG